MEAAAAHLLDFSQPFDHTLLDQIVMIAMDGLHPQRAAANQFLVNIKDHPDMWKRADAILESSTQLPTKIFGLQVLTDAIETRWKVIPLEQREGIRNYIVGKIIALANSDESMRANHAYLGRLNLTLVSILKQDWPHNWPTFIGELVMASKTSESLCENNMNILKLFSEEVFDFSKDTMTSAKAKTLKESLNEEFAQVFQLCELVLGGSTKRSLLLSTFSTLQRFLTWIPLGYIFETSLVPGLIAKFLPVDAYRTATIDCLTEIAALPLSDIPQQYRPALHVLLGTFLQHIATVLPEDINLAAAYDESDEDEQVFVQRLALFLATYLKSFLSVVEDSAVNGGSFDVALSALRYMILVSTINDEEIFKTCLEFWSVFSRDLYTRFSKWRDESRIMGTTGYVTFGMVAPTAVYDAILHDLRIVMIDHMAKPEEVLILEDDNGELIREQTKDTEVIAQYKTMREALVYITNLNNEDTQEIMLAKLDLQVSGGQFNWSRLNTLCWAIGSISGAMGEMDEKRFLVSVIKDLLKLCEDVKGKDNKAVVASNIMYIVGQYPRFLRAHWKFLKTVVNKLFEFMHELHPGVQDMACDTFVKIAQKCKRKFMTQQPDEDVPFIYTLISDLGKHTADLQPHQVLSFYESVATMLSDFGPPIVVPRGEVMLQLMAIVNIQWQARISEGAGQQLLQLDTAREFQRILKINGKVCQAAGSIYVHQLQHFYLDAVQLYALYSREIIAECARTGAGSARLTLYKAFRGVKSEFLELMSSVFEVSKDMDEGGPLTVMQHFLPALLDAALSDYQLSPTTARDSKVLHMLATAVSVFKEHLAGEIPRIMNAIFEPTLELITANMQDHPDHRIGFFSFLRQANQHCFYGLFSIQPHHQKLVVDSIVWALKHTERNISETGLEILLELLQQISRTPQISESFYQAYLLSLVREVLAIMTDRSHKSGFKFQVAVLMHLCHSLQMPGVSMGPLFDPVGHPGIVDNAHFVRESISVMLVEAFPHMSTVHITHFVAGCFDVNKDLLAFKEHVRDFLVTVKEFASEDNSELYLDEKEASAQLARQHEWQYRAAVPGMLKPDELEYDDNAP